jgi:hypothetical protein
MDWAAVITSVSIGTIISTLIGFALQDRVHRQQHSQWLKDKRLEAFTDVAKEFVSFGLHEKGGRSPFESYGAVSRALLLIDDEGLVTRIDHFIVKLNRMNDASDAGNTDVAAPLYAELVDESRQIVRSMRSIILHRGWRSEIAP